jgi:hypothetical protein
MRIGTIFGIAGLTVLTTSMAGTAATLIPVVPFTGSASTAATGINNSDTITGNWVDSGGVEHGFYGTLAGSYTNFDYTGNTAMGTEPRGIDEHNVITGYGPTDGTGNYFFGPEFEYNSATSTMTTITKGGNPLDGIAQQIKKGGTFTGDYWTISGSSATRTGYLGINGLWQQDLSIFGSARVAARGINKSGTIVGWFLGGDGFEHGFILKNGVATQVDFPDPTEQDTYLEGINDKGLVSGSWDNNSGNFVPFAFKLDTTTNTFTSITVPNSTMQQAFGVNNAGLIAINSDAGNFIYCPKTPTKCAALGAEVADGPSITVRGGGWLHYTGPRANASHAAHGSMVKFGPGGPARP